MTDRRRDLGLKRPRRNQQRTVARRYAGEDTTAGKADAGLRARIEHDPIARERAERRAEEERARDARFAAKREERARRAKGNWRLG